jgi:surfeit locus 1 family protein
VIATPLPIGRHRLLVPTLATLVMLAILMSLGFWQVQRLAWKRGLLAAIDHAESAPAVPLPPNPTQFEKVRIVGHFRPDRLALYGDQLRDTLRGPVIGAQWLVPLEREGAPTVLVDRGWVAENAHPATPAGIIAVEGYVREAEYPSWFSAPDDPAGRRFFTLNPQAIAQALGWGPVAPFTLVVLRSQDPPTAADGPIPAERLPRPPNDHLSYAITWFGLALVLVVIFAVYASKGREPT